MELVLAWMSITTKSPAIQVCSSWYVQPLMIWQQRKAETDGLDAYKARNIYYHSIFDDLVKINNRIIVDEPTLRRGLNGCCVPGKKDCMSRQPENIKPANGSAPALRLVMWTKVLIEN